ncbi:MAG: DUF411 domain-containing protein [Methyloversatilis sp.]|jgi:hypothetical protein|uniref:DUF411 domain-containing protein n=1 Tax=Methyloversatilis sp. TaxID=2569862 RepID=UPI0025D4D92F|nr:DUF411 domain-containing protein [Methyloversatilis sp.]MCR6665676.1 DUF411 domain-containing protein [Methyloversatilis sp.]MDP3455895.1 DUF411 domain-containing protein [Methyloversatilis sp.]
MKQALGLFLLLSAGASTTLAQTYPPVEVFKSPTCGCCSKWVEHLRSNGFTVNAHDVSDVNTERKRLGMPERYSSCHTASVGGYVVEGHVPAADIQRLLKEKPKAIGISVPSMPLGSPGMESPRPVSYETLLVGKDERHKVYARH